MRSHASDTSPGVLLVTRSVQILDRASLGNDAIVIEEHTNPCAPLNATLTSIHVPCTHSTMTRGRMLASPFARRTSSRNSWRGSVIQQLRRVHHAGAALRSPQMGQQVGSSLGR